DPGCRERTLKLTDDRRQDVRAGRGSGNDLYGAAAPGPQRGDELVEAAELGDDRGRSTCQLSTDWRQPEATPPLLGERQSGLPLGRAQQLADRGLVEVQLGADLDLRMALGQAQEDLQLRDREQHAVGTSWGAAAAERSPATLLARRSVHYMALGNTCR